MVAKFGPKKARYEIIGSRQVLKPTVAIMQLYSEIGSFEVICICVRFCYRKSYSILSKRKEGSQFSQPFSFYDFELRNHSLLTSCKQLSICLKLPLYLQNYGILSLLICNSISDSFCCVYRHIMSSKKDKTGPFVTGFSNWKTITTTLHNMRPRERVSSGYSFAPKHACLVNDLHYGRFSCQMYQFSGRQMFIVLSILFFRHKADRHKP